MNIQIFTNNLTLFIMLKLTILIKYSRNDIDVDPHCGKNARTPFVKTEKEKKVHVAISNYE